MDEPMNDSVLTATRWIINILMGIMVVACVAIVVILPLSLIYQADFRMEFLEVFPGKNFDYFSVLFSLMLLCALAVLALAFLFLKKLKEIIDTVRSGDPFVRTNAQPSENDGMAHAGDSDRHDCPGDPVRNAGQYPERT